MPINLSKGQKVSLTKDNPGLSKIQVGLGWDVNAFDSGVDFDLDASVFLTDASGKCASDTDFIFYGNLKDKSGSVVHRGDNRTGDGEGDDEQIDIELTKVPENIAKIAFTVTIYDADKRKQNFGQDFSIETAVVVGELYRNNGEWKFNAIGSGFQGGLAALCAHYGIDAA